jgi:hypothetical protein
MAGKKKSRGNPRMKARDRIFVKKMAEGATQTDAAIAAGSKSKRPDDAGHRIMKRIQESGAGTSLLERFGLTDEVLITKYLLPLLKATRTEFFQFEGRVSDSREVPDNTTRRIALEMAFKIKGLFKTDGDEPKTGVRVILIDRNMRPPRPPAITIPTLSESSQDAAGS